MVRVRVKGRLGVRLSFEFSLGLGFVLGFKIRVRFVPVLALGLVLWLGFRLG